jgi:beta-N-acetylhexosaminidase
MCQTVTQESNEAFDGFSMISRRTFAGLTLTSLFAGTRSAAAASETWVNRTLAQLDLDARIGQLMMPMLEDQQEGRLLVERYKVGGFVTFREPAEALALRLNRLQRLSKVPLLCAADFERGVGAYMDGATELPVAMAIGATGQSDLAYAAGQVTASEARAIGVHVVFAPVIDVNNNPKNPIINVRSFGADSAQVGRFGIALVKGLQSGGALATVKHFPGHGNVATDSHRDLGVVSGSLQELEATELVPFRAVLGETQGVMAAHLWVKAFDRNPIPATLSQRVIDGFLRKQLGYNRLIYTDSLGMGGVLNYVNGNWAEAQVLALRAGCDVLVMPASSEKNATHAMAVEGGIKAIKAAVQQGRISPQRIEQSVRRILTAKAWAGLDQQASVDPKGFSVLGSKAHRAVADKIARSALTLVQDRDKLLPLDPSALIGIISLTNREGDGAFGRASRAFVPTSKLDHKIESVDWSLTPTDGEIAKSLDLARRSRIIIIAATLKVFVGDNSTDLLPVHRAALAQIEALNPRIVFISFGSPYALASLRNLSTLICAYDDSKVMQEATAQALWSSDPWLGKLPVTI